MKERVRFFELGESRRLVKADSFETQ